MISPITPTNTPTVNGTYFTKKIVNKVSRDDKNIVKSLRIKRVITSKSSVKYKKSSRTASAKPNPDMERKSISANDKTKTDASLTITADASFAL